MVYGFREIANQLKESALVSGNKHLYTYLDNEDELLTLISDFEGIKSEFYCDEVGKLNEASKFLAIYSDLTSVFSAPDKINEFHIEIFEPLHPKAIDRLVTVPESLRHSTLNKGYQTIPCYVYKNDSDTRRMAQIIDPFLVNGHFLLRPVRTLLVKVPSIDVSSKNYGDLYYAASDTPNAHWVAKERNEKNSFVIDNGLKQFQSKKLFELTLPYFKDISLENLSKILDDESDLLGKFRAKLKDLGKKIIETDNLTEYRNDVIRPEIEEINRKFKTISNLHSISVKASVGTYTLSLLGVQLSPNTNFQTLFNALVGTSALGLWATEVRYQSELDKLKDNPYFLIWKISKHKQ